MTQNPTVSFNGWACRVQKGRYGNGRLSLQLVDAEDGSPVATASVNIPEAKLAADEVAIKSYGENEGVLPALEAAGIIERTGRTAWAGRVQIPVCRVR